MLKKLNLFFCVGFQTYSHNEVNVYDAEKVESVFYFLSSLLSKT